MKIRSLIEHAYSTFNQRDLEGALALMTEDVNWPKASEGGRVVGKQAVRDYWTRQWAQFDPRVNVIDMAEQADGRIEVRVHQVVKDLDGRLLSDSEVVHVYTVHNDLIARLDIPGELAVPSAAFHLDA